MIMRVTIPKTASIVNAHPSESCTCSFFTLGLRTTRLLSYRARLIACRNIRALNDTYAAASPSSTGKRNPVSLGLVTCGFLPLRARNASLPPYNAHKVSADNPVVLVWDLEFTRALSHKGVPRTRSRTSPSQHHQSAEQFSSCDRPVLSSSLLVKVDTVNNGDIAVAIQDLKLKPSVKYAF